MAEIGASELTSVLTEVREGGSQYPVLKSLLRLRALGFRVDSEATAAIARAFERSLPEVGRVNSWIESVLATDTNDAVLHRCVSISCSSNGAGSLWAEVAELLTEAGMTLPVVAVHCLSQCEHGPSLAQGEGVYTGRAERILLDDRPWRESPFNQEG